MNWLVELARGALDLALPPHCAGCSRPIRGGFWCAQCRRTHQPIRPPRCEICSHPFEGDSSNTGSCPNCRGRRFHFSCAVAAVRSHGAVRELIHDLKYHGVTWPVPALAELGLRALRDPRLEIPSALVPVPLHALRRRERGYNQAELLARALSRRSGIPLLDALRRHRPTTTQTHFDRKQRMRNLRNAFTLRHNVRVSHLNLLLVDDVLTTGSTADECARALLAAGARHVDALAIARG